MSFRAILLSLAGILPTHTNAAAPSFDEGMQALSRGDYAIAYCHWLPLAKRGYAEAQYHVGWLYANGNGLAVDIKRALHWWMQAAEQGHTDAQFAVGLAYTTGEGIGKNLEHAVDWYLLAARHGHEDAQDILVQLNGDPTIDLLASHPELARESWFGWQAEVTNARVNLRSGPGTNYRIVAKMEKGDEVRVVGRHGDWLMLVHGDMADDIAWIHSALVRDAEN